MSERDDPKPGDVARATVRVDVPPEEAFRVFTEEIDLWWRRGIAYRVAGSGPGFIRLEPGVGGRLYEAYETASGERVHEAGVVTAWEPPSRLAFEWWAVNFAPSERTEVEVVFEPARRGRTLVTVTHRGWAEIRPDHPARHGKPVPAFVAMLGMWWGGLLTSLREHARGRW